MSLDRIVRGAIYADFVIWPLLRLSAIGTFAFVACILGAAVTTWLYHARPWYRSDLIDALASGSHAAPWGDASNKAARFFPTGMDRGSALALLHTNGFSCANGPSHDSSDVQSINQVGGGATDMLTCGRELQQGVCLGRYSVALTFDGDKKVANRTASYYFGCL